MIDLERKRNRKPPISHKNYFYLLGLILMLIAGGEMSCFAQRTELKPSWPTKFPVMVIAHRGYSGEAPENTLAAFKKAIEAGCDMLELDIHFSKDRQIVVIHDETLERTVNAQGRVSDFNLTDLKKFDAGFWFSPDFKGERIPTLQEVLNLAKGKILVNIEIKSPSHGYYSATKLAEQALKEVKKTQMLKEVIFSSFNPLALEKILEIEPKAYVAILFHRDWNFVQEITKGKSFEVLNLRKDFLTQEKIARIKGLGFMVNVYTVNEEEELRKFVNWGVDGLITNYPGRLIKILQQKK